MYTSDGNRLRSIENQLGEQQKSAWAMLLAGLATGFIGLYFFVARPMSHEMRTLRAELARVHGRMEELTSQGGQVWEAHGLLSSLKAQHEQLDGARAALQSLRELRTEVAQEADAARRCLDQVRAISTLHDRIIAEQPSVEIAGRVVDDLTLLTDRLGEQGESAVAAATILNEVVNLNDELCAQACRTESAKNAARKLIHLQDDLCDAAIGLDAAWFSLHALVTLKHSLMDGAEYVEIAQAIGDQLLALQQRLAQEGTTVELAMNRAQGLLKFSDTLTRNELGLPRLRDNLEVLLHLQQKLTEFPSLAQAIESLDLMMGFQNEFVDQIQTLGEMRKSLVEIALMETTLAKALQTLQPLLELGNLHRMSDQEIKNAARNLLEERTRLSGRTDTKFRNSEDGGYRDAFVPKPAAE